MRNDPSGETHEVCVRFATTRITRTTPHYPWSFPDEIPVDPVCGDGSEVGDAVVGAGVGSGVMEMTNSVLLSANEPSAHRTLMK